MLATSAAVTVCAAKEDAECLKHLLMNSASFKGLVSEHGF